MKKNSDHPKVSVIVTVRNESDTIVSLLESLVTQTVQPDQIVIVDAASTDKTMALLHDFAKTHKHVPIVSESFACNRSTGRNRAITLATSPLIAITDAGCRPQLTWLEELLSTYEEGCVVAGYAIANPQTPFEEAVIPYLLVMRDRVNPKSYLPATRSMLIEKSAWKKVHGFDEQLNTSEDFVFATKLKKAGLPIKFCERALVMWKAQTSLKQFSKTIVSFAACDIRAGILRPKVLTVYGRYLLGALFSVALFMKMPNTSSLLLIFLVAILYLGWAVQKNKKYVEHGWMWLPVLQIIADFGVMIGTGWGFVQRLLGQGT